MMKIENQTLTEVEQPFGFKKGSCHLKVKVAVIDKITGEESHRERK
jgi:hypothetical protein